MIGGTSSGSNLMKNWLIPLFVRHAKKKKYETVFLISVTDERLDVLVFRVAAKVFTSATGAIFVERLVISKRGPPGF